MNYICRCYEVEPFSYAWGWAKPFLVMVCSNVSSFITLLARLFNVFSSSCFISMVILALCIREFSVSMWSNLIKTTIKIMSSKVESVDSKVDKTVDQFLHTWKKYHNLFLYLFTLYFLSYNVH